MATPPLMSERNELHATGWRDCTYASAIMLAYKRGFRAFPLGYTAQEREALERSDAQPDETGASVTDTDVATSRRYGFAPEPVTGDLATVLAGAPATQGFQIGGSAARLPSWLRRWSPSFAGNHSVYVEKYSPGYVRWLDPEAPWGYLGDIVDIPTVVRFAAPLPGERRTAREGMTKPYLIETLVPGSNTFRTKAGTVLPAYHPDHPGSPVLSRYWSIASPGTYGREVSISWPGSAVAPIPRGGPFLEVISGTYGNVAPYGHLYIVKAQVTVA